MKILRREVVLMRDQTFVADAQSVVLPSKLTDQDSEFVLLVKVAKSGTPPALSYIWVKPRFVDDQGNAYRMVDESLGDLIIEVTGVPDGYAVRGKCVGKEIQVIVVAGGTLSTSNYFTVNARLQFYGESEG